MFVMTDSIRQQQQYERCSAINFSILLDSITSFSTSSYANDEEPHIVHVPEYIKFIEWLVSACITCVVQHPQALAREQAFVTLAVEVALEAGDQPHAVLAHHLLVQPLQCARRQGRDLVEMHVCDECVLAPSGFCTRGSVSGRLQYSKGSAPSCLHLSTAWPGAVTSEILSRIVLEGLLLPKSLLPGVEYERGGGRVDPENVGAAARSGSLSDPRTDETTLGRFGTRNPEAGSSSTT